MNHKITSKYMCFMKRETKRFAGTMFLEIFMSSGEMYSAEHVLSVGDVVFNLDCLPRTPVCSKNGHRNLLQGGEEVESDICGCP